MSVNTAQFILSILQFIIVLIGAIWAYFRVWKEGIYRPKIQFTVDCSFFAPLQNEIPVEFSLSLINKGLTIHRFRQIELRVRGIRKTDRLSYWEKNEPRLYFPEKLIDTEVVYNKKYSHIFVEPGVDQKVVFISKIPADIALISVVATFKYDNNKSHGIEKVFQPGENN